MSEVKKRFVGKKNMKNDFDKPMPRALLPNELVDLFKHWDTRVSHQELLYIPLSVSALPIVGASWNKLSPVIVLVGLDHRFGHLKK